MISNKNFKLKLKKRETECQLKSLEIEEKSRYNNFKLITKNSKLKRRKYFKKIKSLKSSWNNLTEFKKRKQRPAKERTNFYLY